jgi:hypothetical protein
MKITTTPALGRGDPSLEDTRLKPAIQVAPLGCLAVCHFASSIGATTQIL